MKDSYFENNKGLFYYLLSTAIFENCNYINCYSIIDFYFSFLEKEKNKKKKKKKKK